MNNISQDKTFAAFTLKSGSKEKSIHSYITKICLLIRDVKNIEIKAYGIFIFIIIWK